MKKKIVGLLLILCLCIGLLASCGNGAIEAAKGLLNDINLTSGSTKDEKVYTFSTATQIEFETGVKLSQFSDEFEKTQSAIVYKLDGADYLYGVYSIAEGKMLIPCEYYHVSSYATMYRVTKKTVDDSDPLNIITTYTYALFDATGKKVVDFSKNQIVFNNYDDMNYASFLEYSVNGTHYMYDIKDNKFELIFSSCDNQTNTVIGKRYMPLYSFSPSLKGYYYGYEGNDFVIYNSDYRELGRFAINDGSIEYFEYINGKFFIQTEDYVADNAKYSYWAAGSEGGNRVLVETFVFDLKSGKTSKLNLGYVLFNDLGEVYNENYEVIGRKVVVNEIENGIKSQVNTYYVIDDNGALSKEFNEVRPDGEFAKLIDNKFLAESFTNTYKIINENFEVLVDLSNYSISSVAEGYITLNLDGGGYYGIVNSEGKFTVGINEKYTYIGPVVSGKAYATKINETTANVEHGILDATTGDFGVITLAAGETIQYNAGVTYRGMYSINSASNVTYYNFAGTRLFAYDSSSSHIGSSVRTKDFVVLVLTDGTIYKLS